MSLIILSKMCNEMDYVTNSAVKRLITINCIQNKSFCLHNI